LVPLSCEIGRKPALPEGQDSGGFSLDGRDAIDILGPFRMPRILGTLHPVPDPSAVLKAELKRRNVGDRELAEKLIATGFPETERNIANKISRGGVTAAFFIQCLSVIGCTKLRLEDA
jgi:hypothetical protein